MGYIELVNSQGIRITVNVAQIIYYVPADRANNSANVTMYLRDGIKLHLNTDTDEIVQLLDAAGNETYTLGE